MLYEKNHINGQMRNKPFLIVIYRSSLVLAAMNAPRVCILRNGVYKTPKFLLYAFTQHIQAKLYSYRAYKCVIKQ
jgi:hypothetical protein